jgi:ABC-2 type transport system permease protein
MIWGSIFGNVDSGPNNLRLGFVNKSPSVIARRIEHVLDTTSAFRLIKTYRDDQGKEVLFDSVTVREFVASGKASAALVIPEDAYSDTSLAVKLTFYYDPKNAMETQMIEGLLQQTIMMQIPQVILQSAKHASLRALGLDSGSAFNSAIAGAVSRYFRIDARKVFSWLPSDSAISAGGAGSGSFFRNILQMDKQQVAGEHVTNPWATRSVGGWAMMFLMFTVTASAASLFDEKKNGVVLRMLAAPMSRVQILWSKYLYNISLGIVQLLVLFIAGAVLLKIDIFSNLGNLLLVILFASTASTAFGMLLSAVSKTEAQARGLGTFLILAMSSIGGAWFPTSMMPQFIQLASKGTIVYWAMDGFLQVLWRGTGTWEILPNLGVLAGIAALITAVSVAQFKKGHVF